MKNQIFETIKPGTKNGRWARPQVTMNAKGWIKINRVVFEMLGKPERIRVLFEKRSQTIALAVPQEADELEDAHVCIAHGHHGEHGGRLIRVYGLVEEIEGDLYTCIRFTDIRSDEHGRLILELSKSVPAFNGTRIGVFNVWKSKKMADTNATAKKNYARRRDDAGGRTIDEYRSE